MIHLNCFLLSLKVTEDRSDLEDLHLYATPREQRFRRFASLEFEGQLYMTPYDFIQAVTNDEPKRKLKFYIDKVAVDVMVMMHVIFPFVFDYYCCLRLVCKDADSSPWHLNACSHHPHRYYFVNICELFSLRSH